MTDQALKLAINKDNNIYNVEEHLSQLRDDIRKVSLKLPRNQKNTFFKNTWISSLITTASFGRELTITDWNAYSSEQDFYDRFSNSLIGITSALAAKVIVDTSHHKFEFRLKEIVDRIVFDHNGLIEDHEAGKSFVICSFDSPEKTLNFPKPLVIWYEKKEEFIRKFLDLKRLKIDYINSREQAHQLDFNYESDVELATLVYELYQNTDQHGKYDEHNNIIQGVRSVSVRRYSSYNTSQLMDQAEPFTELEEYIGALKQKKNLHFYEISISDSGIGIINRFKATRPDLYEQFDMEEQSDLSRLNTIIHRNLSSKLYPGSGLGLTLAFENLRNRRGFLSLRTGNQWVYFNGATGDFIPETPLQSVKYEGELSSVKGTNYNILIPVS